MCTMTMKPQTTKGLLCMIEMATQIKGERLSWQKVEDEAHCVHWCSRRIGARRCRLHRTRVPPSMQENPPSVFFLPEASPSRLVQLVEVSKRRRRKAVAHVMPVGVIVGKEVQFVQREANPADAKIVLA